MDTGMLLQPVEAGGFPFESFTQDENRIVVVILLYKKESA